MDTIENRISRPFIQRVRDDGRLSSMVQGWAIQATMIVEQRYGFYPSDPRRIAHEAAEEALKLALTFILDNDGEYRMVCEERDQLVERMTQTLNHMNLIPPVFVHTHSSEKIIVEPKS